MMIDHAVLMAPFLGKPVWMWLAFLSIVILLLLFDLGVLHRQHRDITIRESLVLSTAYIALGLTFGIWVWWQLGPPAGMEYLTGFAVEKALAMDNVFVIALIFAFFGVPAKYQHRVLFWGILGVVVLRAIMIGLGASIVGQFAWVLYVFAVFLIATGVKMLVLPPTNQDVAKNPMLVFLRRRFNVADQHHGERFFVRIPDARGKPAWFMTPLFLALVLIEVADVIFAVDSVPAIFAITTDPYIVYTSNIFAILGLRALYFALAAMVHRFRHLKTGLALVLVFIGSKIFIADLLGLDKFPPAIALIVTFLLLAGGHSLFGCQGTQCICGEAPMLKGSLSLFRVGETEVRIHPTFFLLLAWIGAVHWLKDGAAAAVAAVAFITLLFVCVFLHEFGHVWAARRFEIATRDVTLLPIGGVASLKRMPEKPSQEIAIALAGPAVNVVIALAIVAIAGASFDASRLAELEKSKSDLWTQLAAANVALVMFNLIPAFPMDGGRVLRALLAMRTTYSRATHIAGGIGQVIAVGLGFVGLFGNPLLILVAVFIFFAATSEAGLRAGA